MQQMDAGESRRQQAEPGYSGYQAGPEYTQPHDPISSYGSGPYTQSDVKIQPPISDRLSGGQRLALAIVSIAIIGLLGIVIGSNTAVGILAYLTLGIVVVAIIIINGFVHRWGTF